MKLDQNEHRLEVKNIMDKKTLQRIIKKYFTTFAEINNFIFYKPTIMLRECNDTLHIINFDLPTEGFIVALQFNHCTYLLIVLR